MNTREKRHEYLEKQAEESNDAAIECLETAIKGIRDGEDLDAIKAEIAESLLHLGEARGYLNARADSVEKVMP